MSRRLFWIGSMAQSENWRKRKQIDIFVRFLHKFKMRKKRKNRNKFKVQLQIAITTLIVYETNIFLIRNGKNRKENEKKN